MVNMMLRWRNIIILVLLFILVREKSQSGEKSANSTTCFASVGDTDSNLHHATKCYVALRFFRLEISCTSRKNWLLYTVSA